MKIQILQFCMLIGAVWGSTIVKPPTDTTGTIGGTAHFVCEVDYGEHIPTMTWLFNNLIIYFYMDYRVDYPVGTNKYVVSNSHTIFNLEVRNLTYIDGGNYTCKVIGQEKSAAMIVLGSPVITHYPSNFTEGTKATYICEARLGGPSIDTILPDHQPQIKLFLDDVVLQAQSNTQTDHSIRKVYEILLDDSMDNKNLKCEIGTTESKQTLMSSTLVNVLYSVRNITYSPQEEKYEFGSNITCSARGNPPPLFEWRNIDNKTVKTDKLLHITDEMEGKNSWTCTARNSIYDKIHEDEITATFKAVSIILQDKASSWIIILYYAGLVGFLFFSVFIPRKFVVFSSKKRTTTASFYVTTAAIMFGSSFQHGWNTGVLNIPQDLIKHFISESFTEHYGFTPSSGQVELLWIMCIAIYLTSGCIGVLIAGKLADTFGRKYALLFCHPFQIFAAIMFGTCKMAHSFELLIVGRFLAGFGCGAANRLVLMYLFDDLAKDYMQPVIWMDQLWLTSGIFFSQFAAAPNLSGNESRWPYMLSLPILPSLVSFVIIIRLPQSPVDHLIKYKKAQKQLEKEKERVEETEIEKEAKKEVAESDSHNAHCANMETANNEGVDPDSQIEELVDNGYSEKQMKIGNIEDKIKKHYRNAKKAFDETFKKNETSQKNDKSQITCANFEEYCRLYMAKEKVTVRELFQPKWKALSPCLMLLCGLNLCQSLSGINVVFYYSRNLFEAYGVPQAKLKLWVVLTAYTSVCANIYPKSGYDKHRHHLLIGMMIMLISSLFMTLALHLQVFYISVLSTNTFVLGFALGFGSLTTCIGSELFFAGPRTPAITIASSCNWLANIFVAVAYPILHMSAGPNSLWIFTIILAIFFIFFFIKFPETKDKSLKKIYEELEIPINNKWPIEAEQLEEMPLVEIKQIPTHIPIEFCSTPI